MNLKRYLVKNYAISFFFLEVKTREDFTILILDSNSHLTRAVSPQSAKITGLKGKMLGINKAYSTNKNRRKKVNLV